MQTEPLPHRHIRQIAICFTQRSGSTMLCEDLTNAGLGRPNEWFTPWITGDTSGDWKAELNAVFVQGTANGIFGVKIAANQLGAINSCLASVLPRPINDAAPFPHLRSLLNDALWVWVRRKDVIGQAISHYLAKQRGIYHVINDPNHSFVPGSAITAQRVQERLKEVPYDFSAIMQDIHAIQRDELVWEQFFLASGIDPYIVWYGDDSSELRKALAEKLCVSLSEEPATRNLVKMPSRMNDEIRKWFIRDLFWSA